MQGKNFETVIYARRLLETQFVNVNRDALHAVGKRLA